MALKVVLARLGGIRKTMGDVIMWCNFGWPSFVALKNPLSDVDLRKCQFRGSRTDMSVA